MGQLQCAGTRRAAPNGARQLTTRLIRGELISGSGHLDDTCARAGLALLFPPGSRSSVEAVEALLAQPRLAAVARVSSNRGQGEGWLELLSSGLTFDLAGLPPAAASSCPLPRHVFGLPRDVGEHDWEACLLAPGPHLADAGSMEPVVRTMASLASELAQGWARWRSAGSQRQAGWT